MEAGDHTAVVTFSVGSLTVVLRDVTEETVILLARMLGYPEVVVPGFNSLFVQLARGVCETGEVEVDSGKFAVVLSP